jgi:hypothetical protein
MLDDFDSNRVMIFLDTVSQDSIIHSHLTQLYKERDGQFYWNLHQLNYWYGEDAVTRQLLKEMH